MADSIPGFSTLRETEEVELFSTGPDNNHSRFTAKGDIASAVVDAGNTPTTTLRGGNIVALRSDGSVRLYDSDATNGDQKVVGILSRAVSMYDKAAGDVVNKMTNITTRGILKSISSLLGIDKAAAAVLLRMGFKTADLEPHGSAFLLHPKARYFKAADYTIVDADHGCMFVATAACNFTLPSLATVGKGFSVLLYNGANTDMVITGAANTIVYGDAGGALSTTLTFSTANKKMGGQALMYADYAADGGSLVWYPLFCTTTITSA